MNSILGIGKWLFILPMLVFGIMHFAFAEPMAANTPGGIVLVYITGLGLVLSAVAFLIGKYDKLASVLLGVMVIIFAGHHFTQMINATDPVMQQDQMIHILLNISIAGAAFMYAKHMARDSSVIPD